MELINLAKKQSQNPIVLSNFFQKITFDYLVLEILRNFLLIASDFSTIPKLSMNFQALVLWQVYEKFPMKMAIQ